MVEIQAGELGRVETRALRALETHGPMDLGVLTGRLYDLPLGKIDGRTRAGKKAMSASSTVGLALCELQFLGMIVRVRTRGGVWYMTLPDAVDLLGETRYGIDQAAEGARMYATEPGERMSG